MYFNPEYLRNNLLKSSNKDLLKYLKRENGCEQEKTMIIEILFERILEILDK